MFMFILSRLIYTAGTGKKRSLSESRGDHLGGAKTSKIHSGGPEGVQYNRLIILEGCSVIGVLLYISLLSYHMPKDQTTTTTAMESSTTFDNSTYFHFSASLNIIVPSSYCGCD